MKTLKYLYIPLLVLFGLSLGLNVYSFTMGDDNKEIVYAEDFSGVVDTSRMPLNPESVESCAMYIESGMKLPSDSVCIYDGLKEIQTYSDIKVWSYAESGWIEPRGVGDPSAVTVIQSGNEMLNEHFPVFIGCPWGCTLGYTE